ncbi:hypothetical protein Tco_1539924 [Tanacetum coccineum]
MLLFIVSSKLPTVKIKGLFQIGGYERQFKCLYLDGRVKSESPELYWLTKARDCHTFNPCEIESHPTAQDDSQMIDEMIGQDSKERVQQGTA